EKSVYNPPDPIASSSIWGDCWLISVQGLDGCAETFVVAASAGNTTNSGFCSWDFDTHEVKGIQLEVGATNSAGSTISKARQWWYKPCGPLIISTCSSQNGMKIFDIRDGKQVMRWEFEKPVVAMEYSSPLQWRDKGKVVVAEAESISLWDVNSLSTQPLVYVPFDGKKISALHVNNTDAELEGGVRRRVSSSEAEGNDGVFCTTDSINILDFRQPSGVGLKIPKDCSVNVDSVFSRGDSVYLGYTRSTRVKLKQPLIQQFSLRKQGLFCTYAFPAKHDAEPADAISQIWVNSDIVMGVCGVGLYVFDALNDDALRVPNNVQYHKNKVRRYKEFYRASFDYMGSHALLISRDKPAMWKHVTI
ncbi:transducin/WD40 repeat protein, partial [Trifolium pratense]